MRSSLKGDTIDSEQFSEYTEDESTEVHVQQPTMRGFVKFDTHFLKPFFTRKLTNKEVTEGRRSINRLANQWYNEVQRHQPQSSDEEDVEVGVEDDADDEQVVFEMNGPLLTPQSTTLRSPSREETQPKTQIGTEMSSL